MGESSFRPEGALRVDLSTGRLEGGETRVVALPAEALLAVGRALESGSDSGVAVYAAGREWGEAVGRRVADDVAGATGKPAREAAPNVVVDHLAGRLAAVGWGLLSIETWADALVFVVENPPTGGAAIGRHLLSGLCAGLATGLSGGEAFAATVVGEEGGALKILVANPNAVKAARRWHDTGLALGAIVDKLHAGEHRGEAGA